MFLSTVARCGVVAVRKEKLEQGACTGINLPLEVGGSALLPPAAVVTRRMHATHILMSTGPLIWCRRCGYYSSGGRVDKLRFPCAGVPANASCRALLNRFLKGKPLAGDRSVHKPCRAAQG